MTSIPADVLIANGRALVRRTIDLDGLIERAINATAADIGSQWERQARSRWPRRTGASAAALAFTSSKLKNGARYVLATTLPYGRFIEVGTRHIRRRRVLRKAWNRTARKVGPTMATRLDKALRAEARR